MFYILHFEAENLINLLIGYIIGNGGTRPSMESNAAIPFAHRMGLISDELYESLESSCEGNYQVIDPRNKECSEAIQAYFECISGISTNHILEPLCGFAAPKPEDMLDNRRSLIDKYRVSFDPDPHAIPFGCRTYGYMLSYIWTNDESVREALHIHKGSIDRWVRCNYQIKYGTQIWSSYMYHVNLSTKGYRSLIYSGDHDMIVPFFATHAWIKSLNYSIVDDWRPWLADGQVAGYTRTYSNQMTFATVKGGGHTAPEYRPPECYEMFKRWINREPL
ncbi:Peptidase S10, serine carboxypeptidase [Dillenia turbinata]|uniref:Peptidase S10, serine carboxypeptidase n=1 Tax=Dillenia turbinata TaxID=194707 RepID=A0AAN8VZB8_9MAGN